MPRRIKPTLREELAAGPRFEHVAEGTSCTRCPACAAMVVSTDRTTGLCIDCWRAWRFARPS